MLSRATVPQPSLRSLRATYAGPFAMWRQGPNEAKLQWPGTGVHYGGYSMEVGYNVVLVGNGFHLKMNVISLILVKPILK